MALQYWAPRNHAHVLLMDEPLGSLRGEKFTLNGKLTKEAYVLDWMRYQEKSKTAQLKIGASKKGWRCLFVTLLFLGGSFFFSFFWHCDSQKFGMPQNDLMHVLQHPTCSFCLRFLAHNKVFCMVLQPFGGKKKRKIPLLLFSLLLPCSKPPKKKTLPFCTCFCAPSTRLNLQHKKPLKELYAQGALKNKDQIKYNVEPACQQRLKLRYKKATHFFSHEEAGLFLRCKGTNTG